MPYSKARDQRVRQRIDREHKLRVMRKIRLARRRRSGL